jgi:hypothetical protein
LASCVARPNAEKPTLPLVMAECCSAAHKAALPKRFFTHEPAEKSDLKSSTENLAPVHSFTKIQPHEFSDAVTLGEVLYAQLSVLFHVQGWLQNGA